MIRLPNPIRTVALCLSACFVADAQAQTAETLSVHEFQYAPPSTLQSALDLRAGSYVLELRGPVAGAYLGRLRGPRNEWVAQDLRFVGNVCSGSAAVSLSTESVPGTHGSNALRLVVGAGACRSEALLPMLGLTTIDVTHDEPDCDPPIELNQIAGTDDGPACSPPFEPELPLVAPRPDVKPRPQVQFAGRSYLWSDRIVLDASQAVARVQGRCIFDYAYVVENTGRANSPASDGSLLFGSRLGLKLDTRPLSPLSPGASQRIQGRFALPSGAWRVYGYADANDAIGEWNGENNVRAARILVTGNCNS